MKQFHRLTLTFRFGDQFCGTWISTKMLKTCTWRRWALYPVSCRCPYLFCSDPVGFLEEFMDRASGARRFVP